MIARQSVVFPQPDSPTRPTVSPCESDIDTPSTARTTRCRRRRWMWTSSTLRASVTQAYLERLSGLAATAPELDGAIPDLVGMLAGLMDRFVYLRTGLALVLGFVGIKMIVADYLPLPRSLSLGIIVLILAVTIAVSMAKTKNDGAPKGRK